ncbi:tail tube protein [Arthrobacter phage Colucci]|uniref:Tail tube protein n=1 Tax=Arthrobacter phage Colucci TaxID=2015834 RepID=A0A286N2T2_9CAUD|nr:tail tube protein [Arthrobacter phage Colucci]ASX98689.1 tail tube protein [Arthrobacter phage Colucci]
MTKATKRQFITTILGITGTWASSTGGTLNADVTRDYDGGAATPDLIGGAPTADDLELSRGFDPVRDLPLLAKLRKEVGRGRYTITKQPTDANFTKVGTPLTYANCVLMSVNDPESDANSSDIPLVTLKFATTGAV